MLAFIHLSNQQLLLAAVSQALRVHGELSKLPNLEKVPSGGKTQQITKETEKLQATKGAVEGLGKMKQKEAGGHSTQPLCPSRAGL